MTPRHKPTTATIRDVARQAGASTAAVSAVLNGTGRSSIRVGPETRARITTAATELGYRPNPLARGLVTGRTGVLGLVFPYSGGFMGRDPFSTQVLLGACEEAVRERYNLMLHTAAGDDWNAADDDGALIDPLVDGLLLVLPSPDSPVVRRCRHEHFPYVALLYDAGEDHTVYCVNCEERTGGRLATEHLISMERRRIAHIAGGRHLPASLPRQQGYCDALAAAGIEPDPGLIAPLNAPDNDPYRAMLALLDLPPQRRPDALFAFNDVSAEAAMRAARDRGLRVPDDLAVVGYDDTWFAAMTDPRLTSVHMPIREMAMRAAKMLIAQVEGKEVGERQPVLPVSLTVRDSSGAPRF